ncbi:ABC transporter ATP-binding protein [Paenibacillus macerans]|uniref:ATP-binding cassette domain-containing protein n=1 Tax=Paenibacillus macerans TaxID=44252 RepID=UPI0022DFC92E|nr:ABC transporter ATP-binding protein [Paenibacillus macerans]MBS5911761.1 ABC transporter ATP-binding protein [Paenibacillus macerans]MEC0140124.1 ABC transporter ATP-binding protein [Paenibacillus macerans]
MITVENIDEPLDGFSLHIDALRLYPGLTLLVGANGAGKTTLLELLATVRMPRRGRILYRQRSVLDDLPLVRSQIGYVPAEIELYEEMTPYKLLAYLSELKGLTGPDRAKELLGDFNLEFCRNTKIKRLSLGVQRRIALAQSLLGAPNFLFLDEPLNAMDSAERKLAINYLNRYAEGRTVIAAVHEMNEWAAMADYVLWLDRGEVHFYDRKSLWTEDLPCPIWEGVIPRERLGELPPERLIEIREVREGVYVKMAAESPPFPGLAEGEPLLEDAYFVRKFKGK